MDGCLACDLAEGRLPLPGGRIAETAHWLVDHTVGPLGVGTLIVRPKRHVVHVWELTDAEAAEMGPFIRHVAAAVADVIEPEQVYVWLFSHAGKQPAHIHWVVQPATSAVMDTHGGEYGPHLIAAMFDRNVTPPADEVEAVAASLRRRLSSERGIATAEPAPIRPETAPPAAAVEMLRRAAAANE